jgi:hypothetical protein
MERDIERERGKKRERETPRALLMERERTKNHTGGSGLHE